MATTKSCSATGRGNTGFAGEPTLEEYLLAQIEHHRTESLRRLDQCRDAAVHSSNNTDGQDISLLAALPPHPEM